MKSAYFNVKNNLLIQNLYNLIQNIFLTKVFRWKGSIIAMNSKLYLRFLKIYKNKKFKAKYSLDKQSVKLN